MQQSYFTSFELYKFCSVFIKCCLTNHLKCLWYAQLSVIYLESFIQPCKTTLTLKSVFHNFHVTNPTSPLKKQQVA